MYSFKTLLNLFIVNSLLGRLNFIGSVALEYGKLITKFTEESKKNQINTLMRKLLQLMDIMKMINVLFENSKNRRAKDKKRLV